MTREPTHWSELTREISSNVPRLSVYLDAIQPEAVSDLRDVELSEIHYAAGISEKYLGPQLRLRYDPSWQMHHITTFMIASLSDFDNICHARGETLPEHPCWEPFFWKASLNGPSIYKDALKRAGQSLHNIPPVDFTQRAEATKLLTKAEASMMRLAFSLGENVEKSSLTDELIDFMMKSQHVALEPEWPGKTEQNSLF